MRRNKLLVFVLINLSGLLNGTSQNRIEEKILPVKAQKELIEKFSSEITENYIYPDKAKDIVLKLNAAFKEGTFKGSSTNTELSNKITAYIRTIVQDNHLGIKFKPGSFSKSPQFGPIKNDDVSRKFEMREPIEYKTLESNIGYLRLEMFDEQPLFFEKIDEAFNKAENTKALIIDLRTNGGGSPRAQAYVSSYLLDENTQLSSIFLRFDGQIIEEKYFTSSVTSKRYLGKPVYILTGKKTFSASENFCYDLQVLKRVTIVGAKTLGGANPGREFDLGNSFFAFIPFGRSHNYKTNSNWEGVGITPEIETDEIQALDKAISLINLK